MAKKTKSSLLSAKGRKALKEVRDKPADFGGGGDLPVGINGGVAKLVDIHGGEFGKETRNAGKPYVYFGAVIVSPKSHEGQKVEGRQFNNIIGLHETQNQTEEDRVARMINELKKLGADTSEVEDDDDLQAIFQELVDNEVHFKFSTWASRPTEQYPNPRVNVRWEGAIEEYEESEEEDDVEEDEEDDKDDTPFGSEEDEDEPDDDDEEEGGDEDEEDEDEDDEAEDDEEEDSAPEKGDIYLYKPPRARKAEECEVTRVNTRTETVSLKSLSKGKTYKDVSWSDISE